jgi:hypothetical protein
VTQWRHNKNNPIDIDSETDVEQAHEIEPVDLKRMRGERNNNLSCTQHTHSAHTWHDTNTHTTRKLAHTSTTQNARRKTQNARQNAQRKTHKSQRTTHNAQRTTHNAQRKHTHLLNNRGGDYSNLSNFHAYEQAL